MAIFADGFESGNFAAWTGTDIAGTGTVTVNGINVHSGLFSFESFCPAANTGDVADCYRDIAAIIESYFQFYIYVTVANVGVGQFSPIAFGHLATTGTQAWVLHMAQNRFLQIRGFSLVTTTSVTAALNLNTWYAIEVAYSDDPVAGFVRVYVDGLEVADLAQAGLANNNLGVDSLNIGLSGVVRNPQVAQTAYYDDATINNTYIGLGINQRLLRNVGL